MKLTEDIKVLDHGYVRFISSMGFDNDIVEAARMSTDKGFISWDPYWRCKTCGKVTGPMSETAEILVNTMPLTTGCGGEVGKPCSYEKFPRGDLGLLDTLWRKKHTSPFEMGELCIEVQAPLFVFREWHRHRTQSYNEFSARYSVMPNLHYVPAHDRFEPRKTGNKQADSVNETVNSEWLTADDDVREAQDRIYREYEYMLSSGIPKEVARINTPVSRYSKMRAKTDLKNWLGFTNLRMRPDAQWEIRQYAEAVATIIKEIWPKTWALFEEYDLYGCSMSRSEMKALRSVLKSLLGSSDKENFKRLLTNSAKDYGLEGTKFVEFFQKLEKAGEEIL